MARGAFPSGHRWSSVGWAIVSAGWRGAAQGSRRPGGPPRLRASASTRTRRGSLWVPPRVDAARRRGSLCRQPADLRSPRATGGEGSRYPGICRMLARFGWIASCPIAPLRSGRRRLASPSRPGSGVRLEDFERQVSLMGGTEREREIRCQKTNVTARAGAAFAAAPSPSVQRHGACGRTSPYGRVSVTRVHGVYSK